MQFERSVAATRLRGQREALTAEACRCARQIRLTDGQGHMMQLGRDLVRRYAAAPAQH